MQTGGTTSCWPKRGKRLPERLVGRLALVTGASSGIGRAVAAALAHEGARVIATARRADRLAALAEACKSSTGRIEPIAGDINDEAFIRKLAAVASGANILVNSAGTLAYAPFLELTADECDAMFATNVLAPLRLSQAIAAAMASRGSGHIIMISSLAAREVFRFSSVYSATKHALAAITKGMRMELQERGVKVTEIAPGTVDTEMRQNLRHPAVLAALAKRKFVPLPVQDVADAVVFAATAPPNNVIDLIELRPAGSA